MRNTCPSAGTLGLELLVVILHQGMKTTNRKWSEATEDRLVVTLLEPLDPMPEACYPSYPGIFQLREPIIPFFLL